MSHLNTRPKYNHCFHQRYEKVGGKKVTKMKHKKAGNLFEERKKKKTQSRNDEEE